MSVSLLPVRSGDSQGRRPVRYGFEDFVVDPAAYEIRRSGEQLAPEPQVFDVLVHLLVNRDRVVTKNELLDDVWRTRFVSESALASRIRDLRRLLGDDGRTQRLVRTVHGRGYRFVGDVTLLDDGPGSPRPSASTTDGRAGRGDRLEQEIRFVESGDGTAIAWATTGEGPPLAKAANWLSHLDHDVDSPVWSHWLRALSTGRRLVRYDSRGSGMSDRGEGTLSLDSFVADLEAVVDAAGLDSFALLGISQGGAVAVTYAARHPERVTRLVLFGAYAAGRRVFDPDSPETAEAELLLEATDAGWGRVDSPFGRVFSAQFVPRGDMATWREFAELQRRTASAEAAREFLEACYELDARDAARRVRAETLVLHTTGDQVVAPARGRELARLVPNSRFVPLDSDNHLLQPEEPAWAAFTAELDHFLSPAPD